jgi:UDPglucose 6-dehydrogenase
MSDGGGCHPRDNIALSWLAEDVGMSHNQWEDLISAREDYEEWHAKVAYETSVEHELPLVLLGKSFKPETKIETGSPAILMSNLLKEHGIIHQHYEDIDGIPQKAVYFIATQHDRYKDMTFPQGSVVLDPFGIIEDQPGITVKRLGRD